MTARVQQALQRYLAAERELEDARWALLDAANASTYERMRQERATRVGAAKLATRQPPCGRSPLADCIEER